MATGGQQYDTQRLNAKVKTLLGRELKPILRDLDLPVSGSKAAMQDRLLARISDTADSRDTIGYNRIKKLISPDIPTFAPGQANPPNYNSPQSQLPSHLSGSGPYSAYPNQRPPMTQQFPELNFKDSPFYDILEPLSQVFECKGEAERDINLLEKTPNDVVAVRESTRDTLSIKLPLQDRVIQRLHQERNVRIMLFAAADNGKQPQPYPSDKYDIAFPHQVDLKVNLDESKANLRGLKNKPGTTRPADITDMLRKIPRYENEIRLTYALTHKKYYIMVNLVRKADIMDLVRKLKEGSRAISKTQVINEMRSKAAKDHDIMATSTVMSLKCPLSTMRIQVPVRSYQCNHNQCFDASAFLMLQEQAPTWSCPICNKAVSNDILMVDKYVEDILAKTKQSVEQVTIEPNGTWSENVASDTSFISKGAGASSPDDEDDDLVEIHDMRVSALKMEATPQSSPLHRTPPASSREQSTASSRPSSNKRPASAITIDLTGSDDEEVATSRPKRPSYASSTSGGLPMLNSERESSTSALYSPNTVPGGITFGIPNNMRSYYPQHYH